MSNPRTQKTRRSRKAKHSRRLRLASPERLQPREMMTASPLPAVPEQVSCGDPHDQVLINIAQKYAPDINNALPTSTCLEGDANLDGKVDFADFLSLSSNFGEPGTRSDGDFTGDGYVGFQDFLKLTANFGHEPMGSNHVPVLAPIDDQVVEFGTKKINIDVPASDADGDHLKYSVAVDVDPELVEATVLGAPFQEMVLDIADGYNGTFPVTVTVHDGHSESQQTFHVTVSPNRPPVLAPIADMSVPAGTSTCWWRRRPPTKTDTM